MTYKSAAEKYFPDENGHILGYAFFQINNLPEHDSLNANLRWPDSVPISPRFLREWRDNKISIAMGMRVGEGSRWAECRRGVGN